MSIEAMRKAFSSPVAWRVKNDFSHWYVTQDKALADTYRDVEKKDVQPLYLDAQPPAAEKEAGSLSRAHEALVAALKAWDAYGGFDTWEDTTRKANAMAEAIRDALTLSQPSSGETK